MLKIKKRAIFFTSGGIGYALIELLWRGRTHPTMIVAGGVCFIMFSDIAERFKKQSLVKKACICACGVTLIELVFGIVFNLIFKMEVWDYSAMPFNLFGQICPLFTFLWGLLGMAFIPLAELMNRKICN